MNEFNTLWIEKYRPKTLKDIVLSDENRKIFEKFKDEGSIPHLLFVGAPGVGKTTLAKIIAKDILDCQFLYINASDESGIDTIRTKVVGFAQTKSIDGKIKVIILDECDGLTSDAQRALRNTMEEYANICRFILTGNYQYRITSTLQSRCQSYDLTSPMDGVINRLKYVLNTEKIKFADKDVEKIARNNYPDLRKCIGQLQKYSKSGTLVISTESECKEFVDNIFKLIKHGKVLAIRKWVIENEQKFNGDYPFLLRQMFNFAYDLKLEDNVKKQYLIVISEFLYRSTMSLDNEINFYTAILQLSEIK